MNPAQFIPQRAPHLFARHKLTSMSLRWFRSQPTGNYMSIQNPVANENGKLSSTGRISPIITVDSIIPPDPLTSALILRRERRLINNKSGLPPFTASINCLAWGDQELRRWLRWQLTCELDVPVLISFLKPSNCFALLTDRVNEGIFEFISERFGFHSTTGSSRSWILLRVAFKKLSTSASPPMILRLATFCSKSGKIPSMCHRHVEIKYPAGLSWL